MHPPCSSEEMKWLDDADVTLELFNQVPQIKPDERSSPPEGQITASGIEVTKQNLLSTDEFLSPSE